MRALKLKLSPFPLPLTTASMQPVLSVFVTICYFGDLYFVVFTLKQARESFLLRIIVISTAILLLIFI